MHWNAQFVFRATSVSRRGAIINLYLVTLKRGTSGLNAEFSFESCGVSELAIVMATGKKSEWWCHGNDQFERSKTYNLPSTTLLWNKPKNMSNFVEMQYFSEENGLNTAGWCRFETDRQSCRCLFPFINCHVSTQTISDWLRCHILVSE